MWTFFLLSAYRQNCGYLSHKSWLPAAHIKGAHMLLRQKCGRQSPDYSNTTQSVFYAWILVTIGSTKCSVDRHRPCHVPAALAKWLFLHLVTVTTWTSTSPTTYTRMYITIQVTWYQFTTTIHWNTNWSSSRPVLQHTSTPVDQHTSTDRQPSPVRDASIPRLPPITPDYQSLRGLSNTILLLIYSSTVLLLVCFSNYFSTTVTTAIVKFWHTSTLLLVLVQVY